MAGGPVESFIAKGRRFTCDAENEVSITPSGFNNEVKPNGDGTVRMVKSRHVGEIEGLKLTIDKSAGDVEFLQELYDSHEFFAFQMTECDGAVWNGEAQFTDSIKFSTKEQTAEVKLAGGKIERL